MATAFWLRNYVVENIQENNEFIYSLTVFNIKFYNLGLLFILGNFVSSVDLLKSYPCRFMKF